MREQLSKYLRGLAEREHSGRGPELFQDLGTFVCWLLERQGYFVHRRTYHFEGTDRSKSAGRPEWGVDVIASKPDPDGISRLYLFVLKKGDFGRGNWTDGPGSMMQDLRLAAGRNVGELSNYAIPGETWQRVTVVAVNNGDLDQEAIGAQIRSFLDGLTRDYRVQTDWWYADRLIDLTLATPTSGSGTFSTQPSAELFPPASQPFARMTLDSLRRGNNGTEFDLGAIDLLLNQVLPVDRRVVPDGQGRGSTLEEGPAMSPLRIQRGLEELQLFSSMVSIESSRVASGSTLPLLDSIERILVRGLEHLRRLQADEWSGHKQAIRSLVDDLLRMYIGAARGLSEKLMSVPAHEYTVAIPLQGEALNYPMRSLRLAGYLAVAIHASVDLGDHATAAKLGECLSRLNQTDNAGLCSPVANDQVIELAAMWQAWIRLGAGGEAALNARLVVERMFMRRVFKIRGAALYQSTRLPLSEVDLQALVEAHLQSRAPEFTDEASTIVPCAVFIAKKYGGPVPDELLLMPKSENKSDEVLLRQFCITQTWQPPVNAPDEWYCRQVEGGNTIVHDGRLGPSDLADAFGSAAGPISPSIAVRLERPSIDWMAWKIWGTYPPPAAIAT
jgi:hypothetical protein